jgi:hypothetical protein
MADGDFYTKARRHEGKAKERKARIRAVSWWCIATYGANIDITAKMGPKAAISNIVA